MKPLVLIPARGGSKGIPGKNIKLLGGKPLIQYTIEAAREVFDDDVICVSTDDLAIKKVAEDLGLKVPFVRPSHLATDDAGTHEVILHAIEYYNNIGYNPDVLILLQPTSPFRTGKHIKEALGLLTEDVDMVVSVKETKANPYFVLMEENNEGWLVKSKEGNFTRRQDCPKVYELNGAIYIVKIKTIIEQKLSELRKKKKYIMDEEFSIDLDSTLDWFVAEIIIIQQENLSI